jgi:hypothetical protein
MTKRPEATEVATAWSMVRTLNNGKSLSMAATSRRAILST